LRIEQFTLEHGKLLYRTAIDDALRRPGVDWQKWVELNIKSGPGYTGFYKDKIIGACGIRLLNDGGGWAWAIISPAVRQHKKAAMRSILVMTKILVKKFELKYLITNSRKGFAASQRLLEHLGFKRTEKETDTQYYYRLEI
jgi:RimJ/RimL family protein N-acetyltransferase